MAPPPRADSTERMIRALILVAASTLFSAVAYWAGLQQVRNQNYVYAGILGIILAAVVVSRFGAKYVLRHITHGPRPPSSK